MSRRAIGLGIGGLALGLAAGAAGGLAVGETGDAGEPEAAEAPVSTDVDTAEPRPWETEWHHCVSHVHVNYRAEADGAPAWGHGGAGVGREDWRSGRACEKPWSTRKAASAALGGRHELPPDEDLTSIDITITLMMCERDASGRPVDCLPTEVWKADNVRALDREIRTVLGDNPPLNECGVGQVCAGGNGVGEAPPEPEH